MRAVVLTDVNRLEVRDVPSLPPAPHEVRLRVAAVGVCGTDLHIVAGHANYNRDAAGRVIPFSEEPQILGHEIAGVVEDVGRGVADLRAGDRVVVDQGRNCVSELRAPLCGVRELLRRGLANAGEVLDDPRARSQDFGVVSRGNGGLEGTGA